MEKLTDEARALRNAVERERYRKDPSKQKNRNIRYWNRKAARLTIEQAVCTENKEKADEEI